MGLIFWNYIQELPETSPWVGMPIISMLELLLESFPLESPGWVFLLHPFPQQKVPGRPSSLSQVRPGLAKETGDFREATTRAPYMSALPGGATFPPLGNQPENHRASPWDEKTCQGWKQKLSGHQQRPG